MKNTQPQTKPADGTQSAIMTAAKKTAAQIAKEMMREAAEAGLPMSPENRKYLIRDIASSRKQ